MPNPNTSLSGTAGEYESAAAGLPVVVISPRQVHDFAKASGQLAKTVALDAQGLAQFAEVMRPHPRPLPDADTRALAALSASSAATRGQAGCREELAAACVATDP